MLITLVTHAALGTPGANASITASCNTTGAVFLAVVATSYTTAGIPVVSDNKGNTWTALTTYTESGTGANSTIYICNNATVGTGHIFTATLTAGTCGICAAAFNGVVVTIPTDQQNGHGAVGATIQPGSITPGQDNELVLTSLNLFTAGSTASINGGFTITDYAATTGGVNYGYGLAYLIQTSAAAANPTWTFNQSSTAVTGIASFKPALNPTDRNNRYSKGSHSGINGTKGW